VDLVYVDDLLILAPDRGMLQAIKEDLQRAWKLKDLGPVSTYLGMEVDRDREARELTLNQGVYIRQVVQRFKDWNLKPYGTPLATDHGLSPATEDEEQCPGQERYPELVGCLMYLMVCTRPDLAHTLSVLGRYVAPGKHAARHWKAALRTLGYVARTSDLCLTLGGAHAGTTLAGFTDASWADVPESRRSSQGYCFTLGSGMISWKATRSPAVALSTCEAELYGGASAVQELMWLKRLLGELNMEQPRPALWCDNQSTVAHTKDPIFSGRSKHIDARYFFIRELVQGGKMVTHHIQGEDNPADLFTKALPQDRHKKMLDLMGLCTSQCG
jgi:hypothetical protein